MKSKWTATFVEKINGNEIRSFGNVDGLIFNDRRSAWEACVRDFTETRKTHYDSESYFSTKNNRIELWNDDVSFVWEVQKMVEYDEANGDEDPSWDDSVEEACEKYEKEKKSVDRDSINLELDNLQKFIDGKIDEKLNGEKKRQEAMDREIDDAKMYYELHGHWESTKSLYK